MADQHEIIQLMSSHRSIRKYKDQPVDDKTISTILEAAQWAPTSHNMQLYSAIVVKDPETKRQLAELCGNQRHVESCPVFLVFVADFYRLYLASEKHGTPFEIAELENVIVGAVDVALVAQNTMLAARSYGLGGVMIGGIRNNTEEVAELLRLPNYTFPVMGMCLGYPDQDPWQKPRFSPETFIHHESYDVDKLQQGLDQYDEVMAEYYTKRTKGARTGGWSDDIAHYVSKPRRQKLTHFIKKQGFDAT